MTTTTRHTLAPDVLEAVCTTARTGDLVATLLAVWKELGFDLESDDCPEVRPWDHAIPDDQWQAICQALIDGTPKDAIGKVNHGLDWMNRGPSSYQPEHPQEQFATRVEWEG